MKFQWHGIRNFSKLASERGVALIVVLWIFIFLFVVAFGFSASVREEAAAAGRYGDETQGYYLAIAENCSKAKRATISLMGAGVSKIWAAASTGFA